jgi:hypothetical protein
MTGMTLPTKQTATTTTLFGPLKILSKPVEYLERLEWMFRYFSHNLKTCESRRISGNNSYPGVWPNTHGSVYAQPL